jgi:hypothetical protein
VGDGANRTRTVPSLTGGVTFNARATTRPARVASLPENLIIVIVPGRPIVAVFAVDRRRPSSVLRVKRDVSARAAICAVCIATFASDSAANHASIIQSRALYPKTKKMSFALWMSRRRIESNRDDTRRWTTVARPRRGRC